MSGYLATQIIRFGGNLILTRLLVPEMFGVMAIVTVIMIGLTMFSDTGLVQNIIRSTHGEASKFLNTAWVVQIIRGGVICILALLISVLLYYYREYGWLPDNTVYSAPILPVVIAVISFTALIQGFNSTKLYVLNRKLMMRKLAILEFVSTSLGVFIMVIWAWLEPGIWALVAGYIFSIFLKMLLSHIMLPGHSNRFEWDSDSFYEIFHFGKWIFVSSILGFLFMNGDRILLSNMISAKLLGIYSIAYFLATAAMDAVVKIIDRIFFPAMGEIAREQPDNLSNIYYKIRYRVDSVSLFVFGLLFITGESLVKLLYDDNYIQAGWMLKILSFSLLSVGFLLAEKCFVVLGYVKQRALLIAIQVITLYALLPITYRLYGIEGAVWLIALCWIPRMIGTLWFMRKYNLLKLYKEFYTIPIIVVGMTFGVIVDYCIKAAFLQ